jgi:hypothetical protein
MKNGSQIFIAGHEESNLSQIAKQTAIQRDKDINVFTSHEKIEGEMKELGIDTNDIIFTDKVNPPILDLPYIARPSLPSIECLNFYDQPKKMRDAVIVPVRDSKIDPKVNRNSLCPCNSGKKFKKCCNKK